MSVIASPDSSTVTPSLWPKPPLSTVEAHNCIRSAFPALVSSSSSRAVLLVPDGTLYLAFRVLRIFHDAGVAVDLLCPRNHPLKRSRYIRHVCEVGDWKEVESHVAGFLRSPVRPWLQIMVAHEPSARRLFASLDSDSLAAWQPGALASPAREFILDKFGLPGAHACWGLPIPPSSICADARQLRDFADGIGWPVIVKPSDQLGGIGIRKFSDERELEAARDKLNFPLLAQKFIVGRRIVLDLLCSRGRLLA